MTSSWNLAQGDEIVPGLCAIKLLGGGRVYEAYLGWDERLFAPVVVKVVRPHLVGDAATMAPDSALIVSACTASSARRRCWTG